jgi:hypothetical protein
MQQFVSAIEQALTDQNWTAALFISLSLPDICSRLQSEDDRTDGKKYASWFDQYLSSVYKVNIPGGGTHTFMSGDDCYVLRCSLLHQGFSDVSHQKKKGVLDRFYFTSLPQHRIQIAATLHLNMALFCREMTDGVNVWLKWFAEEHKDKLYKLEDMLQVHVANYRVGAVTFSSGQ